MFATAFRKEHSDITLGDIILSVSLNRLSLKGIVHHLVTLMSFQTCMTLFLLWKTKEHILKNDGSLKVSVPIDLHCKDNKYNGSQWEQKLVGYKHSSKRLLLCSVEDRNASRFGMAWGWVNDNRILIFGWTIPLRPLCSISPLYRLSSWIEDHVYVKDS